MNCGLSVVFRFAHLNVEIDSVFVYNALCRKPVQAGQLSRMLQEVQVLVFKFSSVQDTFCYIRVADLSANNATTQKKKKFCALHRAAPEFLLSGLYSRFVKNYHSYTSFDLICKECCWFKKKKSSIFCLSSRSKSQRNIFFL